jgi:septal ring factor EnvC (AmiA/AmiB activator)
MRFVSKHVFFQIGLLWMLLFQTPIFAQKNSDKLRKEQERLEKNINNTKSLLNKAKSSTQASLNELKLIDNQVKSREELLLNFDNQIRGAELKIEQKDQQIIDLEKKLKKLKEQYKKLIIYAYKHRSREGKMMYIFSASTYFEALKRNKYLEKIAEIQKKQKLIILQHQGLITNEKKSLETEKERKIRVAEEKRKEKEAMLKDKVIQLKTLNKLKGEESVLMANLKKEENKKAILKQKIKEAIDAEIAAAEKARKEKERKEKKAEEAKNAKKTSSSGSSTTTTPKEVEKKTVTISETKELALNKGFENNKGRLLWPVASGSITEGYGKHAHPTLPNVTTNNNGIDISAPKSAQVRAVYEGEVTSVLSIPGAGKVVIIKHGNYRTVYSNLQESYVSVGSKVNTKQSIGSLLAIEGESLSVAHFEIHLVEEGQVIRINPSLWIAH